MLSLATETLALRSSSQPGPVLSFSLSIQLPLRPPSPPLLIYLFDSPLSSPFLLASGESVPSDSPHRKPLSAALRLMWIASNILHLPLDLLRIVFSFEREKTGRLPRRKTFRPNVLKIFNRDFWYYTFSFFGSFFKIEEKYFENKVVTCSWKN